MKTEMKLGSLKMSELEKICGGKLFNFGKIEDATFSEICTDSREAGFDSLFVAILGERVDGHDYIHSSAMQGCTCFLAQRIPDNIKEMSVCILVVDNPIEALGRMADFYKQRINCKTVAVTGSVGKTTTKEFIYSVLCEKYKTFKTEGNFNSNIGLPMSVLGMQGDAEAAVLEMGMSGFGEIESMSKTAEPDIAIITTIGTSHMERLGSRENICKAKMEIVSGMKKDGILILNGDDPLLFEKRDINPKPVFVAIRNSDARFRALNIRSDIMKTTFDLIYDGKVMTDIEIPVMGQHNVYAALFAIAVGISLGIKEEAWRTGLLNFRNTGMRQNIYDFEGLTIIEDCYNASPESMRSGIDVLSELSKKKENSRSVALLGDMLELGENSRLMHYQVGVYLAQKGCDLLFTYGPMAENIALAAIENGFRAENVYVNANAENHEATGEILLKTLKYGDVLLVKASRSMAEEKIIDYIKTNKDRLFELKGTDTL